MFSHPFCLLLAIKYRGHQITRTIIAKSMCLFIPCSLHRNWTQHIDKIWRLVRMESFQDIPSSRYVGWASFLHPKNDMMLTMHCCYAWLNHKTYTWWPNKDHTRAKLERFVVLFLMSHWNAIYINFILTMEYRKEKKYLTLSI